MCLIHDLASYQNINKVTGLSPATIARLSKIVANRESAFREIIKKFQKKGKSYSQ